MASIQKRVRNDGTVSYRVQIRVKEQPAQTATFEGKSAKSRAKDRAVRTEVAMKEGRHFRTVGARKHTLSLDRGALQRDPRVDPR